MAPKGNILIADDEDTFLNSTADLFRRQGYSCTCAVDGQSAIEILKHNDIDLLIADIKMPGNPEFELVRDMSSIAKGLPIIIVTGFPSLKTAIMSIQLPVVAYLVKPFDFDDLLKAAQSALESYQTLQMVHEAQRRIKEWDNELNRFVSTINHSRADLSQISVEAYLNITLSNVIGSLNDLKNIAEALASSNKESYACNLLNCPREKAFYNAISDAIETIKKSKRAFKSNELGELRAKLESLLKTDFRNNMVN